MLVLAIKNQRIFVITYLPTTPGRLYVVMMLILETQEKELKHPRSLRIEVRHVTQPQALIGQNIFFSGLIYTTFHTTQLFPAAKQKETKKISAMNAYFYT